MLHRYVVGFLSLSALLAGSLAVSAQELTPIQIEGRNIINKNCAVCHLKPQLGAKTYGPVLNRDTLAGNTDAIRDFISIGTERMPGFRYRLKVAQIDSIAAYLKTVPAAAPAPAPTQH